MQQHIRLLWRELHTSLTWRVLNKVQICCLVNLNSLEMGSVFVGKVHNSCTVQKNVNKPLFWVVGQLVSNLLLWQTNGRKNLMFAVLCSWISCYLEWGGINKHVHFHAVTASQSWFCDSGELAAADTTP